MIKHYQFDTTYISGSKIVLELTKDELNVLMRAALYTVNEGESPLDIDIIEPCDRFYNIVSSLSGSISDYGATFSL